MSNLDFVFSLFGVVLALCLAEILTGLAKALRLRRDAAQSGRNDVRLGILTPLLATFVLIDISSFWAVAWALRDAIPASYQVLICGLFATSLYYIAASWVFPQLDYGPFDLDAYYLRHKSLVFGLMLASNVATYFGRAWVIGSIGMPGATTYDYASLLIYYALQLAGVIARGKLANQIILMALLLEYTDQIFGIGLRIAQWLT
jgi:hypothetical protein